MLFPTFVFAVFFAIVMVVGWLLHRFPVRWKLFMLAASYFFYGWWNWKFVGLIVASSCANQVLAVGIHRARTLEARQLLVGVAVAFNLGVLAVFKYAQFFYDSLQARLDDLGIGLDERTWRVVLPVGISFFTFQALSYVLDVHRRVIAPAQPLDFFVYLAFFPQLVAGPIVRASEFLPQLAKRLDPRDIDLTRAMFLIGAGLFKKVVISSYMADQIVDEVFAVPERASAFEVLVAVYAYAIQIYADFSGYTDIAIGVALLLGFQFPQNFNRPYAAVSIQDFWRRWHMTLSRWLRDYLYISLGGNRGGRSRRDRNLFLTMLLGGLWHGAAWNFVFWGALHGAGLGFERRYREARGETGPRNEWLGRLFTFHFVCLGWVFFRADFGTALELLGRLFTGWGQPSETITTLLVATIAGALVAQLVSRVGPSNVQADVSYMPVWSQAAGFAGWLVVVDLLGPEGVAPFIYFQF